MPTIEPIIVLGNGGAAVANIKALRKFGYRGEIQLFSNIEDSMCNPMLTSYYVADKILLDQCYPVGLNFNFYKQHEVTLHLGSPVVELDVTNQIVKTLNGEIAHYDKCLIATGANPIMPKIPGIDAQRVYALRTMKDATRLKHALIKRPKKAVVIGASMVGLKVVELLLQAGVETVLVDQAQNVFPTIAQSESADLIKKHLVLHGVSLRLGAALTGIEECSEGIRLYFSDNEKHEDADLAVLCIGIKPNIQFLDRSMVNIDKGIIIDNKARTNIENVYAAGDVAQGTNLLNGRKEIFALWANAIFQGRVAGSNMAGAEAFYPGAIPQFMCHFMGIDFVSVGDIFATGTRDQKFEFGDSFGHLIWDNNKLLGFNLINFPAPGLLKGILFKQVCVANYATDLRCSYSNHIERIISAQFPELEMGGMKQWKI